MVRPSIKGSAFESVVHHVRSAVSAGALSHEELESRLEPGDMDVVNGEIDVATWYDVDIHDRLLEILRRVRGMRGVRGVGETSAKLLADAGIYQQMDYLNRMEVDREVDPESRFKAYGRDLRLLTTLSAAILNFSRWKVMRDPEYEDRYAIEITDAGPFRDIHLTVIESFMNAMVGRRSSRPIWTFERRCPDVILFRMLCSI